MKATESNKENHSEFGDTKKAIEEEGTVRNKDVQKTTDIFQTQLNPIFPNDVEKPISTPVIQHNHNNHLEDIVGGTSATINEIESSKKAKKKKKKKKKDNTTLEMKEEELSKHDISSVNDVKVLSEETGNENRANGKIISEQGNENCTSLDMMEKDNDRKKKKKKRKHHKNKNRIDDISGDVHDKLVPSEEHTDFVQPDVLEKNDSVLSNMDQPENLEIESDIKEKRHRKKKKKKGKRKQKSEEHEIEDDLCNPGIGYGEDV